MPRKPRIFQSDLPYHITLRANNRAAFEIPLDELWQFICKHLWFCSSAFNVEVHAFVLMKNHYHMIVRTPDANLDKFMQYFNRGISYEIMYKTNQINHKFGARYYPTLIHDLSYYHHAYKYVYRNPVHAGVCKSVEEYKFSSLQFILGHQRFEFPVYDTYFDSIFHYGKNLEWLNTDYSQMQQLQIKKALKSPRFSPKF